MTLGPSCLSGVPRLSGPKTPQTPQTLGTLTTLCPLYLI